MSLVTLSAMTQTTATPKGWPQEVATVQLKASVDGATQPALVYMAKGDRRRPLLVELHTWSHGFDSAGGEPPYASWCIEHQWHFVHPHFRGPNNTPQAMGSERLTLPWSKARQTTKRIGWS